MAHSLTPQHIQFTPGMREDLTDELAPPGSLIVAKNIRYSKLGGIFARPGTSLQSSVTVGTSDEIQNSGGISLLASLGESPVLATKQGKVFSKDTATGGLFNFLGNFSTVLPVSRRSGLITERNGSILRSGQKYAIAANAAGYVLTASSDGSGVLCIALDAPDGTRLVSDYSITASHCSAICTTNGELIMVTQNGTALTGHAFVMSAGVLTYSSAALTNLNNANQYWDITKGPSNSWYLLYQNTATNITLERYSVALAILAFNIVAITVAGNCPCSIFWDDVNSRVWAGWVNDPAVTGEKRIRAWTTAGTALSAVTTLSTSTFGGPPLIGKPGTIGDVFLTYNRNDNVVGPSGIRTVFGYATLPGVAANPCTTVSYSAWWVYAISKPDDKQRSWCVATRAGTTIGYVAGVAVTMRSLLLRWTADASFGSSIVELSGPTYEEDDFGTFPAAVFAHVSNHSGLVTFAVPRQLRLGYTAGGAASPLRVLDVYQYEDQDAHQWRSTVDAAGTIVVAGQPIAFAGRSRSIGSLFGPVVNPRQGGAEIGFPFTPQITARTLAGGALTGTYSYTAVFEWIDTNGARHRSHPSDPVTVVFAAQQATLEISAPNWSQRWDPSASSYPVVHIYRTEAGGVVQWRVTPGGGAPIANDTADGRITYVDNATDAVLLITGEALYTDQALCDYDLAPSCRFMWRDERRVWFGGLWEADQVACTLDLIPDQPIESSDFAGLNGPAFRVLIGEPATGGEYQDGVNYVFAKQAIYAFSGDGPDRQGNGDFSRPRVITRETGCIDYRSVRATSRGIFFQSARGIELIPRGGGNPQFVGAGIIDLVATYSECLGTAVHSDGKGRTLRILMRNPSNAEHIVAVYDLNLGIWSYDSYPYGVEVIGEWPTGTAFGLIDQSETVCALVETNDSTDKQDGGGGITCELRTHVIRPWGLVGFGRLNSVNAIFSKTNTSDSVAVSVELDGVAAGSGGWSLDGTSGSEYREVTVCKEGTGFDVTIALTRSTESNTPVFHGFTIETGQHQGSRRNPAANQ